MSKVQDVFVVGAARTPIGKKSGGLSRVHPVTLGEIVSKEVVKRAGISQEAANQVVKECNWGCATQSAEQGFNVGRLIAEKAFGFRMPASTVNMLCGSSAKAIRDAVYAASSGGKDTDVILVGGIENNLMVGMGQDMIPFTPSLKGIIKNAWKVIRSAKRPEKIIIPSLPKDYMFHTMQKSGDAIARTYKFSRQTLDEFACRSQNLATLATSEGRFEKEIVSVQTPIGIVSIDEGIRSDTNLTTLGKKLKPSLGRSGLHTAGSSSQISAGAAALLIANEDAVKEYNFKPMARVVASSIVGTNPRVADQQLLGPIEAVKKVLAKANLTIDEIDLFEINEAFASVVLATQQELNIPIEKINVNGGAIALGHPLGASGARLPVTLLHEMERRENEGIKCRYGLSVLCIGAGQAIATIFERV